MRRAIVLSVDNVRNGGGPFGAVITRNGEVVATGVNRVTANNDPTAHAEVLALRRAAEAFGTRRLEGCTLYVTLEPCPMCAGAIVMAGIDAVFFGAYDPRCGCAGSLYDLPEDASFGRVIPCSGGLLEAECRLALNAFFDLRRG
mgnify:CR=1 FL=1